MSGTGKKEERAQTSGAPLEGPLFWVLAPIGPMGGLEGPPLCSNVTLYILRVRAHIYLGRFHLL
jgi:hypothetical protein